MDVRMPDGTVVTNVPEGTTRTELLRKLNAAGISESADEVETPFATRALLGSRLGFSPQNTPEQFQNFSKSQVAKALPLAGGIAASLAVPGSGFAALGLQSLAAAGGAGAGELGRQAVSGETLDPNKALRRGAEEGAGNLIGGSIVKGLGAVAKRIFSTPLSGPQTAAAEFAKGKGAPFPLSSAASGSRGARASNIANVTIAGQIRNQGDAVKVGQFINRELAGIESKAGALDEAGATAQRVVKNVFDERGAITRSLDRFKLAAGVDSEIPIPSIKEALPKALAQLNRSGNSRTEAGRKIKQLLRFHSSEADNAGFLLAQDIDDLLFTGPSKGGVRRIIQDAAIKDLDSYGKTIGIKNFGDELRGSIKSARSTLELGNSIRGLKDLAEDAGSAKTISWANRLMENPQTREWLRGQDPQVFHDLADAWAANQFFRAASPSRAAVGQTANGAQVRAWFESNRETLSEVLGAQQAKAWDNFTLYMRFMDKARQAGARNLDTNAILGKAAAEVTAVFAKAGTGALIIPGEGAAFVLARGLNDPSSQLFKLFTKGFSPELRALMRRSGQITGQAIADKDER